MQNLADIMMGTVQYNEEGVLMSIKELCSVMTSNSLTYDGETEDPYKRLVKLAQVWKTLQSGWPPVCSLPFHTQPHPLDVTVEPFTRIAQKSLSQSYNEKVETFGNLSWITQQLFTVCVYFLQIYHSTSKEPCLDISNEKTVRDLMDTSLHSVRRAERQWIYQTCTEFGFCTTHTQQHTNN